MRWLFPLLGFLTALLFAPLPILADEPLPIPIPKMVCSLSNIYCAQMDPRPPETTVWKMSSSHKNKEIWWMPGWFRIAALSNDGEYLVTGYDGLNLLPLDYKKDEVMLSFYRHGRLIGTVKLNEIITAVKKLQNTVSHYQWGFYIGLDAADRYWLQTVEQIQYVYDKKGILLFKRRLQP